MISPGAQNQMNAMISDSTGGGGAQNALEREFSNMAYDGMQQRMPEIMPSVVTFRILETNMETGGITGTFVAVRGRQVLYIPVVLAENKIKPIEMVYARDFGKFLPLTPKWLEEIDKIDDQTLGSPADIPDTSPSDVSLNHIMSPSYSNGRVSYASAEEIYQDIAGIGRRAFSTEKVATRVNNAVVSILEKAPFGFGSKIASCLSKDPRLAEEYLNIFDGPENFAAYFSRQKREVKVAKHVEPPEFHVIPSTAPLKVFQKTFGQQASDAFNAAVRDGYAIKEAADRMTSSVVKKTRFASELKDNSDEVVRNDASDGTSSKETGPVSGITYPMGSGFYRVFDAKGITHDVFVSTSRDKVSDYSRELFSDAHHIIVFDDGQYLQCTNCAGLRLTPQQARATKIYKMLSSNASKDISLHGKGLFIRIVSEERFDVIGPFYPYRVSDGKNETVVASSLGDTSYVLQKNRKMGGAIRYTGSNQVFLSNQYFWLPLKNRADELVIIKQPSDIDRYLHDGTLRYADFNVKVAADRGGRAFYIDGKEASRIQAVHYLMGGCKMAAATAEDILEEAKKHNNATTYAVYLPGSIEKVASIFGEDPEGMAPPPPMMAPPPMMGPPPSAGAPMDPNTGLPMQGGYPVDPNSGAMMDPSMMGMDPSMMGMDPSMMGGMPGQEQTGYATDEELSPPEINPEFQGDPSMLQDPQLMDLAHLEMLMRSPTLKDIVSEYADTLLDALDYLGRILISIYMRGSELKTEMGTTQQQSLEKGVRNLFNAMGETILDLHQNTAVLSKTRANSIADHQNEHAARSSM